MSDSRQHEVIEPATPGGSRLTAKELDWCLRFQQTLDQPLLVRLFALISRLGDGVFWYALMAALLFSEGWAAVPAVGQMALVGTLGLGVYKWLKAHTTRPRPCARHERIQRRAAPLDEYSFPSGHTLHAVAFTLVAVHHYPSLAWLLLPFTALVALSRVILGLHYPSDVIAGALIGAALALLSSSGLFTQI